MSYKRKDLVSTLSNNLDAGVITTTFQAGICNRIYEWDMLRELSKHYKMDILLNWYELRDDAIKLPDTYYYDFYNTSESIINSLIPINTSSPGLRHVADLRLNRNLNYVLTCGWQFRRDIIVNGIGAREISVNTAYENEISDFLNAHSDSPIIGLHVRRGDYLQTDQFCASATYRLHDKWYINIAKKVQTKYPNARFFLASDGTKEEKQVFIDLLPVIAINSDRDTSRQDLLELFTLARLPLIIGSVSTYSMLAKAHGGKTILIWPACEDQDITEELKKVVI